MTKTKTLGRGSGPSVKPASWARITLHRINFQQMDRSSFPGYRATFAASDDDEIRKYVLAELAKTAWAPRVGITIVVTDGIVELDGAILDEKEREALRVAAENVRGVKGVLDHLVCGRAGLWNCYRRPR